MKSSELVTVKTVIDTLVHLPNSGAGDYATLCGLDGMDDAVLSYQELEKTEKGAKLNCPMCIEIIDHVRGLGVRESQVDRSYTRQEDSK